MKVRYYSVTFKEVGRGQTAGSACPRGCMCCGQLLSGVGGPGDYICGECLSKMRNDDMHEAVYLLKRERDNYNISMEHAQKERAVVSDLVARIAFVQEVLGVLGNTYRNDWSEVDGRNIRSQLDRIASYLDKGTKLPVMEEWMYREFITEGKYGYEWK